MITWQDLLNQLPQEPNKETNIWRFDDEIQSYSQKHIETLYNLIIALGICSDPGDGQYDNGVYWISIP
jgi:hypothetical protein